MPVRNTPGSYLLLILFGSLFALPLKGQEGTFSSRLINRNTFPALEEISDYHLIQWDAPSLFAYLDQKTGPSNVALSLGPLTITASLTKYNRHKPGAMITQLTPMGPIQEPLKASSTFKGTFVSGNQQGQARFTVRPNHFSGSLAIGEILWILEPLWYYLPDADPSILVLYQADHARALEPYRCGADHHLHPGLKPDHAPNNEPAYRAQQSAGCKEVAYAVAADWLFVSKFGGSFGAMDRIGTIMALVEWQYTGKLGNNYMFPISEYVLSTCSTCDPAEWTNTTDAVELLFNFRSWGEGGGFANGDFDVAGIWTGRTFSGPIIGVAFIEGACSDYRYHALTDFSPNTSLMRVMVSHEFGHNFSAEHDASGNFIMAPQVNQATSWSPKSVNEINAFTNAQQCFDECIYYPPPTADFSAFPTSGCAPLTVYYNDLSLDDPTEWNWSFPGGVPSTSQEQNPVITYSTLGFYQAKLVVSSIYGSDSLTITNLIAVDDGPDAQFFFIQDGLTVYYLNESERGDSYFWDFGDGYTSTETNPEHTYAKDGTYVVKLEATNACGVSESIQVIVLVTAPVAGFTADTLWGCAPLQVHFTDQSSPNTTNWKWSLPGATPDSSTVKNPVVTYADSGTYQVMLVASNNFGTDTILKQAYISVIRRPDTAFVHSVHIDSLFVRYEGLVDSVYWDFGDSTGSKLLEAGHLYAAEGNYILTLTIYSACGIQQTSRSINILFVPEAALQATPMEGCAPMTVQYTDLSSANAASREWFFEGGNPATSSDSVVTVLYGQSGMYPVTLIVTNAVGADTLIHLNLIQVDTIPIAAFTFEAEGMTYTFKSQTPGADSHEWAFGDGFFGAGDSIVHTYFGAGVREVIYTVSNLCGVDTATASLLLVPSALEDVFAPGTILLAPNPVSDWLSISQPSYKRDLKTWMLLDVHGNVAGTGLFNPNNSLNLMISMQHYPSGLYFLQLLDQQGQQSWHKVVRI